MSTKPDNLPEWASQDDIDSTTGQHNIVEPPPWKKEKGWSLHEFPPRQWFNWLHNLTYQWLKFLGNEQARMRTADGNGVGLFPLAEQFIVLMAVKKTESGGIGPHYMGIGYRGTSGIVWMKSLSTDSLALGSGSGANQPVTGSGISASDIITIGLSLGGSNE